MHKVCGLISWGMSGLIAISFLLVFVACDKKTDSKSYAVPVIGTAVIRAETIPIILEFPGSLKAVMSVDLMARVEGFLISRNFDEGSIVQKGALLFQIDPKPFQAALKKAEGGLAQSQAALIDAQKRLERQRPLAKQDFISRQAFDNLVAQVKEYEGQVKSSQADVENAKLNLGYCSIYAPFTGRIGYTEVDVGNLVSPTKNPKLAQLVKLDPIYVVFRPDNKLIGRITEQQAKAAIQVSLSVSDNGQFSHHGQVDSIDNRIDPTTNTIKVRGVIPNPKNLLIPGEYSKVRAFLGDQVNTVLVPQAALEQQQAGFQVYVVANDNTVTARSVTLGPSYLDMRIVLEGLKVGEEVAVTGLQKLKSGGKVKRAANPTPTQSNEVSHSSSLAAPSESAVKN